MRNVIIQVLRVGVLVFISSVFAQQSASSIGPSDKAELTVSEAVAVLMFPNPATNYIQFYCQGDCSIIQVSIKNSSGELIREVIEPKNLIDISLFKSGVYIVEIKTQHGMIRKELFKE